MHRTDGDGHVSNMFDEGDPEVPRQPTQIDKHWLNAIQEEIVYPIAQAGITLVKGTNTQLLAGLRVLLVNLTTNQTIAGIKSFVNRLNVTVSASNHGIWVESDDGNAVTASSQTGTAVAAIAANARALTAQGPVGGSPVTGAMRIVPQDADPSSALRGDLYVNSGDGTLRIYNGSAWVKVGTQS